MPIIGLFSVMPRTKMKKLFWVVSYDNPMDRSYEVMGFSSSYLTLGLGKKYLQSLSYRTVV